MTDSKKELNLLGVGLNSELVQKAIVAGFTLTELRKASKDELAQHFDDKELESIRDTVTRKPIPSNTLQQLIEECDWKCCVCWNYRKKSPIIIHHIEEYSRTHDDSYGNLVILCLNHHAEAHSKWEISRHPLPPELIRTKKRDWIEALKEFKAGHRRAPGDEITQENDEISKLATELIKNLENFRTSNPKAIEKAAGVSYRSALTQLRASYAAWEIAISPKLLDENKCRVVSEIGQGRLGMKNLAKGEEVMYIRKTVIEYTQFVTTQL